MTDGQPGAPHAPHHLDEPIGHAGHPEVGDGAAINRVESRGIDYIPEENRHSRPARHRRLSQSEKEPVPRPARRRAAGRPMGESARNSDAERKWGR
jgi:hypothetical protein